MLRDFAFLSGGTGTPKLIQGFREITDDENLSVICNTGDDLQWYGLHVSPDLDTILYLFSGKLDTDKFWGVNDEEFTTLRVIQSLGLESWFNIGNKDLGLHIFRNYMASKHNLTEITDIICKKWNIKAKVIPMCDQPLQSIIHTDIGELPFQEYFVKYRYQPEVKNVKFKGDKSRTNPKVLEVLDNADQVIMGPSNPVTSIGPILSIEPIRSKFESIRDKVLAISPIVSDKAFSGPSTKLMRSIGIDVSVVGLAKHYKDVISKLVIAEEDRYLTSEIEDQGIEAIVLPIELKTLMQKKELAQQLSEIV